MLSGRIHFLIRSLKRPSINARRHGGVEPCCRLVTVTRENSAERYRQLKVVNYIKTCLSSLNDQIKQSKHKHTVSYTICINFILATIKKYVSKINFLQKQAGLGAQLAICKRGGGRWRPLRRGVQGAAAPQNYFRNRTLT